jgi:predicted Zn-dependent peptidase
MALLRSFGAIFVSLIAAAGNDNLSSLTKAVTAFKLPNGAQFLVVERPYSPMIAFHFRVNAGTADEPHGRSGLATLALMSFLQGSEAYGTRNQAAEKTALAEASRLMDAAHTEGARGDQGDDAKKARLEFQARTVYADAANLGIRARYFEGILIQNGAANFEVRSMADYSDLAVTVPSDRAELWFRMLGSWLQTPSPRFFPQSRDMLVDQRERSAKTGAVQRDRAFASGFSLHPYQATAAGDGELNSIVPSEVLAFMRTNYAPANLTLAMVGDISPAEARRLAEVYFGKLPVAPPPEPRRADLPKADNTQPIRLALPEAPIFAAAWPRPAASDKSNAAFDVVQALLGGGPGSRIYNELMAETKLANRLTINTHFPGARYPGFFVIEAEPLQTRSHEEVEAAIIKALEGIAKEGVTAAEVEKARTWLRNHFVADSRPMAGRALQLVRLQSEYGTYKIEEVLAKLEAVTPADCQRVVSEYFAGKPYFSVVQLTAVDAGAAQ